MSSREKVIEIIGTDLSEELGDVVIDYISMSLPAFDGDVEEFFDASWPFFDGSIEEDKCKLICEELFQSFNKELNKSSNSKETFFEPMKIKDMFTDEPTISQNHYNQPVEFLFKKSEKKTEKKKPTVKSSMADFIVAPFILDRSTEKSNLSKDIFIPSFDVSIGGKTLIRDATLKILNGRRYGLVGRNGTGKSTLLRHISLREIDVPKHLNILHVAQEVVGDDTPVLQSVLDTDIERSNLLKEEKEINEKSKAQNTPEAQKQLDERLIKIYARLTEINADESEAVAAKILSGLGFTQEMQQRTTKEYSGGWRMRISLARALFCSPDVLLLDEPTNMLDVKTVIWLEQYLLSWNKTLIVVSHDRSFLNNIATDIIHLHGNTLNYYSGDYESFVHTRNERLMVLERAKQAQDNQRKHIQSFIDRFRYNANRAALVQSRLKRLEKMEVLPDIIEDPTLSFTFPKCTPLNPPVIQFKDVGFGYKENELIFDDVNFSIDLDSRIAIVGPNGSGKSTLLNLIAGDIEPTKGYLFKHGRLRLARFSQHHVDQLDLSMSPVEVLRSVFPGKDTLEYRSFLGRYGISGDLAGQKIDTLSGGQKSRVVFALMGMLEPQIMILDEPVNHLDIETVEVLTQALNDYNGGVVLISHDERLITHVCDEIWVIENGHVTPWKGEYEQYKKKLLAEMQL